MLTCGLQFLQSLQIALHKCKYRYYFGSLLKVPKELHTFYEYSICYDLLHIIQKTKYANRVSFVKLWYRSGHLPFILYSVHIIDMQYRGKQPHKTNSAFLSIQANALMRYEFSWNVKSWIWQKYYRNECATKVHL